MKTKRVLFVLLSAAFAGAVLLLLLAGLRPQQAAASEFEPSVINVVPAARPFVVVPNQPQAHEPTELRVILFNDAPGEVTVYAQFYWAEYGIGTLRHPIGERVPLVIAPQSEGSTAVVWVPPEIGPYGYSVEIFDAPGAPSPILFFEQNVFWQGFPDLDGGEFVEVLPMLVRNPLDVVADVTLEVQIPISATGWQASIVPELVTLQPGEHIVAAVTFTYTFGFPPDGTEVFNIFGFGNGTPIGHANKVFGPPLALHVRPEPGYAESEISIHPYPVPMGEPAEICVEVRNLTFQPRQAWVSFRVAPFGIGAPFEPVAPPIEIIIPERGLQRPCIMWVAPEGGQFAFEVAVDTPGYPLPIRSQRVMDVSELLLPGTVAMLHFPVRNPTPDLATIDLVLHPHIPWGVFLMPIQLPDMQPFETRWVTLTVEIPPDAIMPPDEAPVVDVEALIGDRIIGGFRKIYRPPVPIHRPGEPIYAESEIMIRPYPPRDHEPTEICVEVRNPTDHDQMMVLDFRWAEFGIGQAWQPIRSTQPIPVPAHSIATPCSMWVPPHGGRFGFEVEVHIDGVERSFISQRVIDVGEILRPNEPAIFEFPVSNPFTFPITVTLGAIRYLPQWDVWFEPYTFQLLPNQPAQWVVMHVVPVQRPGDPEPHEGMPVIDVEAYWQGNGERGLLGGFRKLFFPPIPVHNPNDPPFAEREIHIMPYPPRAGEPTEINFEARNPTTQTQVVTVTFEVGNLGIGLPFNPIGTRTLVLAPESTWVTGIMWVPPWAGEFCARVRVEAAYFPEPFVSSRNISIVHLPPPYGTPEVFPFVVGDNGITTRPLTITLGLRGYLDNWQLALNTDVIILQAGQDTAIAELTIVPPANPMDLPRDGGPIADVAAFVNGELIGGIRKVWRPPVPLGDPHEPGYAELEISVNPYPPVAGETTTFSAEVRNTSDYTQTIQLEFGWANFGFGIPFSNTNVVPTQTAVTLSPFMTTTVSADWVPDQSGHFCVQINLTNPGTGDFLHSQRNVEVVEHPGTGCEPFTVVFLLQNATSETVTVTIGSDAINLPPGWSYTVSPEEVVLGPYESIPVTVTITPPCDMFADKQSRLTADGDGTPAVLDIEGYTSDGELLGGIEVQLVSAATQSVFLPLMMVPMP